MKTLKKLFKEIYTRDFTITEKGAINQTQRNNLKNEILDCIATDISKDLGIEVLRVDKGLALNIDHENEGALPITLDVVIKNTTFDTHTEHNAYVLDKELKAERKAKRKRERQAQFKNDTKKREMLQSKKV
jgi:hypothetical protein